MPNGTEGFSGKVVRHIREGSFDPPTLKSGVEQFLMMGLSPIIDKANIKRLATIENFGGVLGLSISEYIPIIQNKVRLPVRARVYDFPFGSLLDLMVLKDSQLTICEDVLKDTNAFGLMIGPTAFEYQPHLPNNGFFSKENLGDFIAFPEEHILSEGAKKGAFGQTEDNRLMLLDDITVRGFVSQDFGGLKYLSGTSFTLGIEDQILGNLDEADLWSKSQLSYLFEYLDIEGNLKNGYAIINVIASRMKIFEMIADYISFRNGQFKRAVELEYTNSDCHIKMSDGSISKFTGVRTASRRDYYLWRLPANS